MKKRKKLIFAFALIDVYILTNERDRHCSLHLNLLRWLRKTKFDHNLVAVQLVSLQSGMLTSLSFQMTRIWILSLGQRADVTGYDFFHWTGTETRTRKQKAKKNFVCVCWRTLFPWERVEQQGQFGHQQYQFGVLLKNKNRKNTNDTPTYCHKIAGMRLSSWPAFILKLRLIYWRRSISLLVKFLIQPYKKLK